MALVTQASAVEDRSGAPTELEAVTATSATDAWAVGFRDYGAAAVILHWDGHAWSAAASPAFGKLFGVSATSSSDAWAVGSYSAPQTHKVQTFVLHWDGAQWTRVASPNPSTFLNLLYGVSAVSPQDAWGVGYSLTPSHHFHSLLLHWNGVRWSRVTVPGQELDAVTAISSSNVWAGGLGVLLHWNGTKWSKQSVHTKSFLKSVKVIKLLAFSALSAKNIWAVGQRCANYGPCVPRTEVIHWNGRHWSTVRSPMPSHFFNFLGGVAAVSPHDVWAVGAYCPHASCKPERTLILHWNGQRWSTVPSPSPSSALNVLAGIGAVSATQMWAVGADGASAGTSTLLLDGDGAHWSVG